VKVTVFGGGVAPTGTVVIGGDAEIPCTLTLSGGIGSCSVVFNTIGSKAITATYSGDSNYSTSSALAGHTVANVSTTTITSQLPNPSYPGDVVTVNFTVSGAGVTPTGTVDVTGADSPCAGIALAGDGTGTCTVTFDTAGAKILTATFASGDLNYTASSGTASHTVNKGPSTTTIGVVTPNPSSAPNEIVTVPVTVAGAGVTPTGTVGISVSGQPAVTCTLTLSSGVGSCTVSFPTAGTYTITTTYSGDGNYLPSTDTYTHIVS
jgi:hypothetical protein